MILFALGLSLGLGVGLGVGFWRGGLRVQPLQRELGQAQHELGQKQGELKALSERIVEERAWSETHFKNLANQILETQSERIQARGELQLKAILEPVRERLHEFEKKVGEVYQNESRERFALKHELEEIVRLNQQMSSEAKNLTQALKGDSRSQGNWGELVLEKILQHSGLREGIEYTAQGKDLGLTTDSGKRQKPDIVVHLPDEKHLIIDSKVSLTAYERSVGLAEGSSERALALQQVKQLFVRHIDELSQKHYQALEGIQSPDFVLMFLPIEGVFSMALQLDPELFLYSWDKKIVLVSPTTLLATLRTVASLWKQEHQSRNALEIARQGGALYDKVVAVIQDFESVGVALSQAHDRYHDAFAKLKEGRGNVVSRIETLRKLGAKVSKKIDAKILETAVQENEEAHPGGDSAVSTV